MPIEINIDKPFEEELAKFKTRLRAYADVCRKRADTDSVKATDNRYSKEDYTSAAKQIEKLIPFITEDNLPVLEIIWSAHVHSSIAEYPLWKKTVEVENKNVISGKLGRKRHDEAKAILQDFATRYPDLDDVKLAKQAHKKMVSHTYLPGQNDADLRTVKDWVMKVRSNSKQ